MSLLPNPIWPVIALAVICVVDAVMCLGPVPFIRDCLRDVGFPRRSWPLLPALKFAAAAGLVVGLWIPGLALLTCAALVAYFLIAIALHVRAKDFGRNLFVNASGMLAICVAVPAVCLVA